MLVCCVAGLLGLGACEPAVSITDDVDRTWDFSSTQTDEDARLHSPYVLGAQVALSARSSDDGHKFDGWSIVSSDPEVFRIDEEATEGAGALAHGQAVGAGTTTLRLLDGGGHEVERAAIEVLVPDRVELDAPGPMFLGHEAEAALVQPRVVEGGTATLLVRYFRGARELGGRGAMQVVAPSGIVVTPEDRVWSERREWISLVATKRPPLPLDPIELRVGGITALMSVEVVPASDVAGIEVATEPEDGHGDGDFLAASAQAVDGGGARLFGVAYAWEAGGLEGGEGDFYRYRLNRDHDVRLVAHGEASSTAVMIHADEGDVVPAAGCSAAGGSSLLVGLVGLALVVGRRRRG